MRQHRPSQGTALLGLSTAGQANYSSLILVVGSCITTCMRPRRRSHVHRAPDCAFCPGHRDEIGLPSTERAEDSQYSQIQVFQETSKQLLQNY